MGEYLTAARDNAPAGGVFTPLNLQTYHYAGNNPLKYTDPSGRARDADDPTETNWVSNVTPEKNQETHQRQAEQRKQQEEAHEKRVQEQKEQDEQQEETHEKRVQEEQKRQDEQLEESSIHNEEDYAATAELAFMAGAGFAIAGTVVALFAPPIVIGMGIIGVGLGMASRHYDQKATNEYKARNKREKEELERRLEALEEKS